MAERALAPTAETSIKRRAPATCRPGEGDHIAEIDAPEGISAARGLDGGAERTKGVVSLLAQTGYGRLDRIEIGDQRPQLRMLDAECLAADRDDSVVSRSARSRRSRCFPTSPVAPATSAVRCGDPVAQALRSILTTISTVR